MQIQQTPSILGVQLDDGSMVFTAETAEARQWIYENGEDAGEVIASFGGQFVVKPAANLDANEVFAKIMSYK